MRTSYRRFVRWQAKGAVVLTRRGCGSKIDRMHESNGVTGSAAVPAAAGSPSCASGDGPRRRGARRALVAACLVLLPAVMFAGVWENGGAAALEDDLIYYLPTRQYIGERIRAGDWPAWNPYVGLGGSVAADPQSGLWYPGTLLFVVLPPLVAYCLTLYLHFILAGWGMYRFLRSLRRAWPAALLGALAFELTGYMVAHRAHLTIHHAVAWLPWILLAWQRYADTGGRRYLALSASAFGLQMLVQHLQPSIMTVALVSAYVLALLLSRRRSLLWAYPLGMTLGACVGAVQLAPAFFQFAGSGRGRPPYALFVENSWSPLSAVLLLFPTFYGLPIRSEQGAGVAVWRQTWWGESHFCEQWAYMGIALLLLAVVSLALLRRDASATDVPSSGHAPRREAMFWWGAIVVAGALALGELNPLSRLLFHVPVYGSLRVPARWILVWCVALPVLGSLVMSVVLRDGSTAKRLSAALRRVCTRVLPIAVASILGLMLLSVVLRGAIVRRTGSETAVRFLTGLHAALTPTNPALWWPLVLMTFTAAFLVAWSRRRSPVRLVGVFVVFLFDVAAVTPFVDVNAGYLPGKWFDRPVLANALRAQQLQPGQRILVPREQADYARPVEVSGRLPTCRIRSQRSTATDRSARVRTASSCALCRGGPMRTSSGCYETCR
jgi:hypothetical protein